jgi:hypothetical protein
VSTLFATGATRLTERLESTLKNPASSSEFDLPANTNEVLSDVLAIRLSDGRQQAVPLAAEPVAEVDGETLSALASNHTSWASPTR